jgi:hypothetical protein
MPAASSSACCDAACEFRMAECSVNAAVCHAFWAEHHCPGSRVASCGTDGAQQKSRATSTCAAPLDKLKCRALHRKLLPTSVPKSCQGCGSRRCFRQWLCPSLPPAAAPPSAAAAAATAAAAAASSAASHASAAACTSNTRQCSNDSKTGHQTSRLTDCRRLWGAVSVSDTQE